MKRCFLILLFLIILIIIPSINSADEVSKTMTVESNIIGFGINSNLDEVGIEIPDHVFLGNITVEDPVSEEIKIYINNTGKTNISVVPRLKDDDDNIYSNLFFRTSKSSSNEELNKFYQIGDYQLKIEKPAKGSRFRSKYCYMQLNLENFEGEITEDLISYKSEIVFFAIPE